MVFKTNIHPEVVQGSDDVAKASIFWNMMS